MLFEVIRALFVRRMGTRDREVILGRILLKFRLDFYLLADIFGQMGDNRGSPYAQCQGSIN